MVDICGEEASGKKQKTKLGLVETCADEGIQRQLSAMGRKHNISENIAAKRNDNGYVSIASHCKTKIHNYV